MTLWNEPWHQLRLQRWSIGDLPQHLEYKAPLRRRLDEWVLTIHPLLMLKQLCYYSGTGDAFLLYHLRIKLYFTTTQFLKKRLWTVMCCVLRGSWMSIPAVFNGINDKISEVRQETELCKSHGICCPLVHLFTMVSSFKSRKVKRVLVFSAAGTLPNAGGKTTVVW